MVKNRRANVGDARDRFDPWVGKIWSRKWQPTLVLFLPGKFHGQRSPAGYSPWGHKELDTTEWPKLLVMTEQEVGGLVGRGNAAR